VVYRPRARHRALKLATVVAILALAAFLARDLWLPWLGYLLIHEDGPAKADLAVVLAGDYYGHRIEKAGDLVRAGYVPAVLVSGPSGAYGNYECDLAIAYAIRKGYPAAWFIRLPNEGLSTREEAAVVLPELRRRGVHSVLVVTSDYHTGRARRVYAALERGVPEAPAVRVVAAPDEFFRAASWWRTRPGRKVVLMEWSKSLADALGM
jgi:uncharacterized SAM-binding protein YcdF (DUF218 family)